MPTVSRYATVKAPADVLWRRLADLESWPRWLRVPYASYSVDVISSPPVGVGTEFVLKGRLRSRLFARVTEWREQRCLAFEFYRSEYPSDRWFFGRATIRIDLDAISGGQTSICCTHRLEGRGLLGRLYGAFIMRPFLSGNVRSIVDSLRAAA